VARWSAELARGVMFRYINVVLDPLRPSDGRDLRASRGSSFMSKVERVHVQHWLRGMRMVSELRDRSANELRVTPGRQRGSAIYLSGFSQRPDGSPARSVVR
jgi:hypothetical protein